MSQDNQPTISCLAAVELVDPLRSVYDILSSLLSGESGPISDGQDARLRVVHECIEGLITYLSDLSDLNLLNAGLSTYHFQPFSLRSLVGTVMPIIHQMASDKGLGVKVDLGDQLPDVYGDLYKIRVVLLNFIQNAIEYTEDGTISILARDVGDAVQVTIRDTGIGIPEEDVRAMFQAFSKVEGNIPRHLEGKGLRLTVNKRIISAHGGRIGVESVLEVGSAFHFTIPTSRPGEALERESYPEEGYFWSMPGIEFPVEAPVTSDDGLMGHGELILAVDDNPLSREHMRALLTRRHFRVELAVNGFDGLARAQSSKPDLILVDLMMPRMNGIEFIRNLRADPECAAIPVILLAARNILREKLYAYQVGAQDVLALPFAAEELMGRVNVLLKLKGMQEELKVWNRSLERLVQERTAELEEAQLQLIYSEKMYSVGLLTAGILHEINNPLGYVNSNIDILTRKLRVLSRRLALDQVKDQLDQTDKRALGEILGTYPKESGLPALVRELTEDMDWPGLVAMAQEVDRADEGTMEDLLARMNRLLARSAEGVKRVKRIIQNLKSFTRLDEAAWQDADIHDGLEATINMLGYLLTGKDIVIERRHGLSCRVFTNPTLLNQVFTNILVNAIQAVGLQGTVRVQTNLTPDAMALIRISDTGPGIPEERRHSLFNTQFTTKPPGEGSGLGLMLSKRIIESLGGRIEVESIRGRGTAFSIILPLKGTPPKTPALPERPFPG